MVSFAVIIEFLLFFFFEIVFVFKDFLDDFEFFNDSVKSSLYFFIFEFSAFVSTPNLNQIKKIMYIICLPLLFSEFFS